MLLAVIGGKGGVGKSTVAYNLGGALDAVVVDGDLGMADLPAPHGPDLHDVLAGRATPAEAVRDDGPVGVLPCGRSLAGARAADPRALAGTLQAVAREYGRVVVDCPAGLGADVGLPLVVARACVVVTTLAGSALADAIRARGLARELDTGLARVVANRVPEGVNADATTSRIERALGAPVVEVPESGAVARAWQHGRTVGGVAPESAAAGRFEELAAGVERTIRSSSPRATERPTAPGGRGRYSGG